MMETQLTIPQHAMTDAETIAILSDALRAALGHIERVVNQVESARAAERERCADICHQIAMAAFVELGRLQKGNFDYCTFTSDTSERGQYLAADECEKAIRALKSAGKP